MKGEKLLQLRESGSRNAPAWPRHAVSGPHHTHLFSSSVDLHGMRLLLVSHRRVRGYVSACPDGAPTFLRTGSIKIYDIRYVPRGMAARPDWHASP